MGREDEGKSGPEKREGGVNCEVGEEETGIGEE